MTDVTQNPTSTVKQSPTNATYARAAVTTGSTVALPFAFQQLVAFLGGIVHDVFPAIREPTDAQALAIGIVLAGMPTFWAAFSIRGTRTTET